MRRVFASFLSLCLCMVLVGCRAGREADRRFMVSALGFDADGSQLLLSAETVIVNSESTGEDISTRVFSSRGADAEECVFRLIQGMSKDVQLAHCGVVAVGDTVRGAALDGIIEYCTEKRDINLSTYMVSTANASELLSGKAVSAITVGYELMGFMEHAADETGIRYGARVYEVQSARMKKTPVYLLPRFSVASDSHTLDGTAVFVGNRGVMSLSADETAVYSMITGSRRGGKVNADGVIYNVGSVHTYIISKESDGVVGININVLLPPDQSDNALCRYVERCAAAIVGRSGGADVFGVSDMIYAKNYTLWQKISNGTVSLDGAAVDISCERRQTDYAK